jgi:hypothetical protein
MNSQPEEFAQNYSSMGETELFDLARAYDSLTEPAQAALRAEFVLRHLEPPEVEEADVVERRQLVTVRRYRDLSEAIVARSLLESAGITVYLQNENLIRLDWPLSNFVGGIRLQVDAADEAAAVDLLSQPVPESISFGGSAEFDQPACPRCGSLEITFDGSSRDAAFASTLILGVPLPLGPGREGWHCDSCGARWEVAEGDESEMVSKPGV